MLKPLLAALLLLAVVPAAEAYDKKRVDRFCREATKSRPKDFKACVIRERNDGKLLDEFTATAESSVQKGILKHCLSEFSQSYSLALFCLDQETKRAHGLASIVDVPDFDTEAYCRRIAATAGGSYQIEATCRDTEGRYRDLFLRAEVPADIMSYCTRIARTVGGSYQIMATCVEQELTAKASLQ